MSLSASGATIIRGNDSHRLHRRVVRAGAAASWLIAALFLVAGLSLGEPDLSLQSIGPALAAAAMTVQILLDREDARLALGIAALVIVIAHTAVGLEAAHLAASLALVLVGSVAMLFVGRNPVSTGVATGIALTLAPQLWFESRIEALGLGLAMGIGFAIAAMVLTTIVDAALASSGHGGPQLFPPQGSPDSRR